MLGFFFFFFFFVSHPLQLTTGLVVNSLVITSPTLAGEHMLLIPKASILSEQTQIQAFNVVAKNFKMHTPNYFFDQCTVPKSQA